MESAASSGAASPVTLGESCDAGSLVEVVLASGAVDLARSQWGNLELKDLRCVGDWAMARTVWADPNAQNADVLFHRIDGAWRYVTVGGYMECTGQFGVPADVAARLGSACH